MPKAYGYQANGGPEVEEFLKLPMPTPGSGQLLVRVRAAGVNPADWKRRNGLRMPGAPAPQFPIVMGGEVAGVVEATGPDSGDFTVGDAVFGNTATGGFTEYTLLPVETTAHKPEAVSFIEAATLPIAAATAYDGIHQLNLPPGATLLIIGVGGGVGIAAAQIARHGDVSVIGTASTAKREFVESLGVIHVAYGPSVADRIRSAAPHGIDGIYDQVGGAALAEVAPLLADRSKLVSTGDRALVAELGGAFVVRARNRVVLEAVAQLVVDGALRPSVTATFPLAQVGQALRAVEDGHAQGKIVVDVSPV
jgi:NADPH:quinone reductase-like Zn-dependent oxidoreductase